MYPVQYIHTKKEFNLEKTCIIRVGKEVHALNITASYNVTYVHSKNNSQIDRSRLPNVHLKNVFVILQRCVCRVLCLFIRLNLKKLFFFLILNLRIFCKQYESLRSLRNHSGSLRSDSARTITSKIVITPI